MFIGYVLFCLLFSGFGSTSPVEKKDVAQSSTLPAITETPSTKCNHSETIRKMLQVILSITNQQIESQTQTAYFLNLLIKIIDKNVDSYDQKEAETINDIIKTVSRQGPVFAPNDHEILKPTDTKINFPDNKSLFAQALLKILQVTRNAYTRLLHGDDELDLNLSRSDSLESPGGNSQLPSDHGYVVQISDISEPRNHNDNQQAAPLINTKKKFVVESTSDHDHETKNKHTTKYDYDLSDLISNHIKNYKPTRSSEEAKGQIKIVHENPEIRANPELVIRQHNYIDNNNPPYYGVYTQNGQKVETHIPIDEQYFDLEPTIEIDDWNTEPNFPITELSPKRYISESQYIVNYPWHNNIPTKHYQDYTDSVDEQYNLWYDHKNCTNIEPKCENLHIDTEFNEKEFPQIYDTESKLDLQKIYDHVPGNHESHKQTWYDNYYWYGDNTKIPDSVDVIPQADSAGDHITWKYNNKLNDNYWDNKQDRDDHLPDSVDVIPQADSADDHILWKYNNELNDNYWDNKQDWDDHYYIKVKFPVSIEEIADPNHYDYPKYQYNPDIYEHLHEDICSDSHQYEAKNQNKPNDKIKIDIITPPDCSVKKKQIVVDGSVISTSSDPHYWYEWNERSGTTTKNTIPIAIDSNQDPSTEIQTEPPHSYRTSESDESSKDSKDSHYDDGTEETTDIFSYEITDTDDIKKKETPLYFTTKPEIQLENYTLPETADPIQLIINVSLEANYTNSDRPSNDESTERNVISGTEEQTDNIYIVYNGSSFEKHTSTEDNTQEHEQYGDAEVLAKLTNNGSEPDPEGLRLIIEVIENIEEQLDPNIDSKWLATIRQLKIMIIKPNLSKNTYIQILEKLHQILKEITIKFKSITISIGSITALPRFYRLMTKGSTKNHVVEVVYLIKSPIPTGNPYYFIKYHIPVNVIDQLLLEKPLVENEQELHLKLLKLSKIVSRSAALEKISKEDVYFLTMKHGYIMITKLRNDKDVVVYNERFNPEMKNNFIDVTKHKIGDIQNNIKEVRITVNDKPYNTITTYGDFKGTPIAEDRYSFKIDKLDDLKNPFREMSPMHKLSKADELAPEETQNISNTENQSLKILDKEYAVTKVPIPYSKTIDTLIKATELATIQRQKIAEDIQTEKLKDIESAEGIQTEKLKDIEPAEDIQTEKLKNIEPAKDIQTEKLKDIEPAEGIQTEKLKDIEPAKDIQTEKLKNIEPAKDIQTEKLKDIEPGDHTTNIREHDGSLGTWIWIPAMARVG